MPVIHSFIHSCCTLRESLAAPISGNSAVDGHIVLILFSFCRYSPEPYSDAFSYFYMQNCCCNSRFSSCEFIVWHQVNTGQPDLYGNCKLSSTICGQYLKNYTIFLLVLFCITSAPFIATYPFFFCNFICINKAGRSSGTHKCLFNALYLCREPANHPRFFSIGSIILKHTVCMNILIFCFLF